MTPTADTLPLAGSHVVNAGVNIPADVAAGRLSRLGAVVTKVEPPGGDPLELVAPGLYAELTEGQAVVRLDLKSEGGRTELDALLHETDLLLTSSRPSALDRLGLGRAALQQRHPSLCRVAIVGHAEPRQELAGHDLTYVAAHGLIAVPELPRTLVADLGGAERTVTAAVLLLLTSRSGTVVERYTEVSLADCAEFFALPLRHGLTAPGGLLGGGDPYYGLYEARDGWVALGALEPRFRSRLAEALGTEPGGPEFARLLGERTATEWERWGEEHDIPLAALRVAVPPASNGREAAL